ncbi:MAG: hypothetical protein JXA71_12965 [Chitinispirillaceae bacterium]|nr:hypothetical protein [Chitinispirillaceae bacterium]
MSQLLPGFIAGCIFVLLVWGLTALIGSKARQKKSARKDEIISSIENKWIDVDGIIQSYRQGRLLENVFRNELARKLEAINRLFKPAMHQMDLYYVKYTEKIIAENNRFLNEEIPMVRPTAAFKALPESAMERYREQEMLPEDTPQESEVETGISQPPEPAFEATAAREPAMEDALPDQSAEQPEQEPQEEAFNQDEPVISAMEAESSSEASDILPIETFLEMETGTGMAAEQVNPAEESGIEDAFPESSQSQEAPTPYVAEETNISPQPPAVDRTTPEEDEQLFEGGEQPDALPPPPVFAQRQEAPDYPEETMSEEPVYEYAPMSTPDDEPVPPPPPFDRQPGQKRDETVEPATIYDIEAETIIADRSEIMGTKKPPKEESQRSGLGITGDDISDQLDNFFNIK